MGQGERQAIRVRVFDGDGLMVRVDVPVEIYLENGKSYVVLPEHQLRLPKPHDDLVVEVASNDRPHAVRISPDDTLDSEPDVG